MDLYFWLAWYELITLGIGKSAAFAALAHNLNYGGKNTRTALLNAFTVLKPFRTLFISEQSTNNFLRSLMTKLRTI